MIPKVFHFIWIGDDPLPKWAEENICSWLKYHLGWRVYLWTNRQERELVLSMRLPNRSCSCIEYYDSHPNLGSRSDMIRLAALRLFGGLYLDVDVECWGSIDRWMNRSALLIEESAATPGTIGNSLMAFTAAHPFLDFCLANLVEDAEAHKERISLSTGPGFITRMHRAAGSDIEVVSDHKVFYPFDWAGPRSVYPETIAVHQWRGSWRNKPVKHTC